MAVYSLAGNARSPLHAEPALFCPCSSNYSDKFSDLTLYVWADSCWITGYTSITAFSRRSSGIYGSVADHTAKTTGSDSVFRQHGRERTRDNVSQYGEHAVLFRAVAWIVDDFLYLAAGRASADLGTKHFTSMHWQST